MPQGNLTPPAGGIKSALNIIAPTVIKASAGRLVRITQVAAGSAGNLVLNDCARLTDAGAANTIDTIPFGAMSTTSLMLDFPCATGIVVSSVPTGGSYSFSFS